MFEPLEPKASAAIKDYGIDYTNYLAEGVTLSGADWEIISDLGSPDLEMTVDNIDGNVALVRLSGGEEGRDYILICTATTSTGEELPEAIKVRVKSAAEIAGL
jgi:hypothetical protein